MKDTILITQIPKPLIITAYKDSNGKGKCIKCKMIYPPEVKYCPDCHIMLRHHARNKHPERHRYHETN